MRFIFLLLAALVLPLLAKDETPPPGGTDLLDGWRNASSGGGKSGEVEKIRATGADLADAMKVTVDEASPEKPWNVYVTVPLAKGSVQQGDRLLVSYMARCLDGAPGQVLAKVQRPQPTYDCIGMTEFAKIGKEWTRINHPLIASTDTPDGKGEITMFFGKQIQTVEIANVRLLNYGGNFDIAKLPRQKATYEGREPDAPWRKSAMARIEKIRMQDHAAILTDGTGKPLSGKSVTVNLHRHDFGFGTCVTRGMLTKEGSDGDQYRDIVNRTCSRVVFENDLKPDSFPSDEKGFNQLTKSFEWLKAHDITVRGHYLIQEAVDGWTRSRLGDPMKLRKTYMDSIRERIQWVGDRVIEWDAVNHPIAWGGAEMLGTKGPPLDTLSMDVFREARRLTNLPILINEDQIFRPGPQQDKTFELLEKLKRDGVRVDGLGNQGHFNSSFLPSPEEQLRITQRFSAVVPKQVITEWDIVTNGDEELAADYLRDSLIACFSHPAYDGFLLWGFWEKSHWIPAAVLWRSDWSPKPIAKVWEEMTTQRFHTRRTLTTDSEGRIQWRGFKGTYRLEVGGAKLNSFRPGTPAQPAQVKAIADGSQ